MGYKEFALQEFKALGYKPIEECEEDPDKWIQENVLELLEVFSKQGHSGMSAPYAINMFKKLASWEPLSPVNGEDWEWNDISRESQKVLFQNKRCSGLFKEEDGSCNYVSAIVWQGPDDWDTFTGSGFEGIGSSLDIKGFPFTPKTFYIDVTKVPFDSKIHDEEKYHVTTCGDGDYVYAIKDHNQLKEVFDYYKDPRKSNKAKKILTIKE